MKPQKPGVFYTETETLFCVWAPLPSLVELHLPEKNMIIPMEQEGEYWKASVPRLTSETLYFYRLNGNDDKPDPCSLAQPQGVHGPSQVVDRHFNWEDQNWKGVPLDDVVFYELHVGTFTPEGTFDAVVDRLEDLKDLGITALEIMPVAQFPGERNWGYDGVYPFAVQWSYGGHEGLKRLVDAAHKKGMAVILDVVYNHLGPEGNYLGLFGPYFTDCYSTPWGGALNYDQAYSDSVREFFTDNARFWIKEFHIDGLRLDACHLIMDMSPRHILTEIHDEVKKLANDLGRHVHLVAETDANDTKCLLPREKGGNGLEAQWLDDFHHALYVLLEGTNAVNYLPDYHSISHLIKSYREGYVYSGEYCPSRKRKHGTSSARFQGDRFVVFIQNHDQVGNKPSGIRLANEVSFETAKLAAVAYILSPYLPLLFMGEDYGEKAPFQYFTSHSDEALIEAVRTGRKEEFALFGMDDNMPDPQDVKMFEACKLNWQGREETKGKWLREFYKYLLECRRSVPALKSLDKSKFTVRQPEGTQAIILERNLTGNHGSTCLVILNFANNDNEAATIPVNSAGRWNLAGDSADVRWGGPGTIAPLELLVDPGKTAELLMQSPSAVWYISD